MKNTSNLRRFAPVLGLTALATLSVRAQTTPGANWPTYNGPLRGTRFSPQNEITTANVSGLRPVARFDTEAEAIEMANDNTYGLAASVWTRDVDRSYRVARQLESGTVWINDWAVVYDEFEEGGFKQSGVGRLNGLAALDDFLQYKHIAFNGGAVSGQGKRTSVFCVFCAWSAARSLELDVCLHEYGSYKYL